MRIDRPPIVNKVEDLVILNNWLFDLYQRINDDDISATTTWNPGSIADGDEAATDVTVTGVELGDYAVASFSLDVTDLLLNAQVTSADTVTCVLGNLTGSAVDLAEGTLSIRVFRRTYG